MTVKSYMADISKIKQIPYEEQLSLMRLYRAQPTIKLRNVLIEQNLKLVFKVAGMYSRSGIPLEDLIAEGNFGLIRGIEKFDPNKGVKLGYYLFQWISAKVLRLVVNEAHLVKMGTTPAQRKLFWNLSKIRAKATAQGIELTNGQIAKKLGVTEQDVEQMSQRLSAPVLRIENSQPESCSNFSKEARRDYIMWRVIQERIDSSDKVDTPECLLEKAEVNHMVTKITEQFLNKLNNKKRVVFIRRFCKKQKDTFEDIANDIGVTKQRTQQIEKELKAKMKKFCTHNQISLI